MNHLCPDCGEPLDVVDLGVRSKVRCPDCGWHPEVRRRPTRQERLEAQADAGYDTLDWEER
jgi:DNA-directed RNA polymerase subunit RPC12/RpoP